MACFITFLPALVHASSYLMGFTSATFSDADFSIMALIFGNVALNVQGAILPASALSASACQLSSTLLP